MSGYYFECVVTEKIAAAEEFFELLNDASWNRSRESQGKVRRMLRLSDDYALPLFKFDLTKDSKSLRFSSSAAPSFGYEFFESIIHVLDGIAGIHYHAEFFDSSSGGGVVWRKPSKDIVELEGKKIVFLGEMQEELDEMIELAEDFAIVQAAMGDDTEVIVVGAGVNKSLLQSASKRGVLLASENDFWAYVSSLP